MMQIKPTTGDGSFVSIILNNRPDAGRSQQNSLTTLVFTSAAI
jgi:hypothetical protein